MISNAFLLLKKKKKKSAEIYLRKFYIYIFTRINLYIRSRQIQLIEVLFKHINPISQDSIFSVL